MYIMRLIVLFLLMIHWTLSYSEELRSITWKYQISVTNHLNEPLIFRFNGSETKTFQIPAYETKTFNFDDTLRAHQTRVLSYHELMDISGHSVCDTQLTHLRIVILPFRTQKAM
jgi:hypothetical protein